MKHHFSIAVAFCAFVTTACSASSQPDIDSLTPGERSAARGIPAASSAVFEVSGRTYHGAFSVDVAGSEISLNASAIGPSGTTLTAQLNPPGGITRARNGSFHFDGVASGVVSMGLVRLNGDPMHEYSVREWAIRVDETGLLSADLRLEEVNEYLEIIASTSTSLNIRGHLTGTCRVVLDNGDVLLDPEFTVNPLCEPLLSGL